MENIGLIADRYANALAQSVRDPAQLGQLRDEIGTVAALVTSSNELSGVLKSPIVSPAAKEKVMLELASRVQVSQLAKRFISVIGLHGRFSILPAIAKAISRVCDERAGIREVELSVAAPMEASLRARLETALATLTGGQVRIRERVDPAIIGGVVAKIGTTVYDGSLKAKLEQMRSRLAGRAGVNIAS